MISNRLKCVAALLAAFMLLALPAGASDLVESGENISCDNGVGNDALVLSVEEDLAPAAEVAAASTDVSIKTYWKNPLRRYDFVVTIGGAPQKQHYLFIEDAGISDAGYPLIKMGQPNVEIVGDAPFPDAPAAAFANERRACDGTHFPDRTAATVQTGDSGFRNVYFSTSIDTVPRSFTISVVDPEDEDRNDAVRVTIQEGEVTITAEGAGTYSLGEVVRITGTNTDTDEVFLFMTGRNLGNGKGVSLEDIGLKTDLDLDGAVRCDVESDGTWEYRWDTSAIGALLVRGAYAIYAVSKRENAEGLVSKGNLKDMKYQSIGIYLKEPVLTLDDGTSMVAGGDELKVSGYADGDPDEVLIWIVGKECPAFGTVVPVQSDGSFEYTLGGDVTAALPDGQYFVVVQHPRYDRAFNVCPDPEDGRPYQIRDGEGKQIDLGACLPSEAVATLLSAIEGTGSDDIHAETSFTLGGDGVTVAVEGTGVFVLGDEVTISGINTGSEKVYLFLTGGDLGDGVAPDDLGAAASEGNYVVCEVAADDTWEYRWDTAALRDALAAGTYTLYAADRDHDLGGHAADRSHLDGVRNATATMTLKRPALSASFNRSTYILKGEALEVSGTATGHPATVRLWALGNGSKVAGVSVPVADDGTYEYVLGTGESAALSGDVRVLVQHPMTDRVFNVCPAPAEGKPYQIEDAAGNLIDLSPLSASEAEDVLVDAMTAPGSDDHYNALSIMIGEHGVTAAFEGDGNYAIGDTITFSGTAADTDTLYLFVHGPNLGDGCPPDNLGTPVSKGRYGVCEVATDGTWEYQWDTSSTVWAPDSGIYTLYVAATDHDLYGHAIDAAHLHGVRHAAVDVSLHRPTLTAALDRSSIRQGDALLISGAASGSPETLQFWIFGANRRVVGAPVPVADDGTFEYVLGADETADLTGSYAIVVQHPGGSCNFDVYPDPVEGKPYQIRDGERNRIDLGILPTSVATTTFIAALNSPYSDDLYAKLNVTVEAVEGEEWIRLDPIEDVYGGDTITFTGITTLATGTPLSIEVTSLNSFPADQGGITGEAVVVEGTPYNTWSCAFDTPDWPLGEYTMKVTSSEHALSRLGTFVLQLRQGSLDVTCAPAILTRGEPLTISGKAAGGVRSVQVWVIGNEYLKMGVPIPVGADQTFTYTLEGGETNVPPGQYTVIVQHSMYDGVYNVYSDPKEGLPYLIRDGEGKQIDLGDLLPAESVAGILSAIEGLGSDDIHAETSFSVEDEGITVAAEGSDTHYLGDEIRLSGTNTLSDLTSLFLAGPNLGSGVPLNDLDLSASDGDYTCCKVGTDDTWEYLWDTSSLGKTLNGKYRVYAVSDCYASSWDLVDTEHLEGVKYATTLMRLQHPYPRATLNTSVLQPGDSLLISGTATGCPENLSVWIFSKKNRLHGVSVPFDATGAFEYLMGPSETENLSGQSFAVIQHPGANGVYDVVPDPVEGKPYQIRDGSGNAIDLGVLPASEAATALIDALNADSTDDTYAKIPFFVEGEDWIRIDPIGAAYRSDIVTVTGTAAPTTATGLCVRVSPHNITVPDEPGTSPGEAWGEVTVQEGTQKSAWSFAFETSGWSLGEYTVKVETPDGHLFHEETFVLRYGYVDAACAPITVAQGKSLTISGKATGGVDQVRVWVVGKDCLKMGEPIPVADDGTFAYALKASETKKLSGSYSVIVQHPMADSIFNVRPSAEAGKKSWMVTAEGETIDLGNLSTEDAVAALTDALASPNSDDSYENLRFVVTKAASPSSDGGGGAAPRPPAQPVPQVVEKIGSAYLEAGANGTVETGTVVLTREKHGSLFLDAGVRALDLFGRPLERVSVKQISAGILPDTGDDDTLRQVGPGLKCGPDGATFEPAAEIVFTLIEDEWESLGTDEGFVVRWYNTKADAWEPLSTKMNPAKRQVIARAPHFTTFAVFAESLPVAPAETTPVEVTKTLSAGAQVEASDGVPTTEEPVSSGSAPWMTVAGVGAALVLAGVICAFWKRR